MEKYLITGGAGFIGSAFIRFTLSRLDRAQIINLDKLTYAGNLENLKEVEKNPRYQFIRGDIADRSFVEEIFKKGVDLVINFAAETHVDRSIANPEDFIRTDIYGSYVLLEVARNYRIKRFVQISTDEVYGSCDVGSFRED